MTDRLHIGRRAPATAIAAIAVAFAAAPALAGGVAQPAPAPAIVPVAPAPAPSADWTGAYGGLQLEYGDVTVDGVIDEEGDGGLAGVFAGYRYDFGTYVIGAEIDINGADIDLPAAGGNLDTVARLGVEAGLDAGPALIYGTAGAAMATVDAGADTLAGPGYFYGVGVDYAVTDQITVGAEVLQHEFDDFDDTDGLDVSATTFGVNAAFRF